ncbi:MAG: glycosyltransferase [Bacteroidetes bacterium]|nr:glycosyltransferase [Bacteroidota bacterium]
MKVAFIIRSTAYSAPGGDTLQVQQTARALRQLNVQVDIKLAFEKVQYTEYDLLHFFNIIRPADMLLHIQKSKKPFVVSSIFIDYSAFDTQYRSGISGRLFKYFSRDAAEYMKTVARFLTGRDKLVSKAYLWKGHGKSIRSVLSNAQYVLVQAEEEYNDLVHHFGIKPHYAIIKNGVDAQLFAQAQQQQKDEQLVLCVGRIEGIKNQYHLIRALNNTPYQLVLIGDAATNQRSYFEKCKAIAADNVHFIPHLPQEQLVQYYNHAKVHVLPSWFEVCGLSSLEAGVMGCNIVITKNGYASSYFGNAAYYCDPADPASIAKAVQSAAAAHTNGLQQKIRHAYTWQNAAMQTLDVYKKIVAPCNY